MKIDRYAVAVEMPCELWVNDNLLVVFMCSPYDLKDLAIGHLLTRGHISHIDEIKKIHIDYEKYKIEVETFGNISEELYSIPKFILSGSSSVSKFSDNIYKIKKVHDIKISLEQIIKSANSMIDDSKIYKETGGVHAAIITDSNGKSYLREDIGRHSAVDKVVGAFARENGDFSKVFICTTGRISLDMLLKSSSVGIPVVASLKYPSDLGIHLAEYYGISIVARVLSYEPIIFTNPDKIL